MVKTPPSNAGGVGLISGQKIPRAAHGGKKINLKTAKKKKKKISFLKSEKVNQ